METIESTTASSIIPTRLNLGCGLSKFDGYINIDIDPEVKPDVVSDIVEYLKKQPPGSIDEIVMFHTLEHTPKCDWLGLFSAITIALKVGGSLMLSFPEFGICAENYLTNKNGKRSFWEATLYGRQLSDSDYHISICQRNEIASTLVGFGFEITYCGIELADYNSFINAVKVRDLKTYEHEVKFTVWE